MLVSMSDAQRTLAEWAGASTPQVALIFTDMVDSTALLNRIGDKRWVEVLVRHLNHARSILKNYDCHEIKFIGDSFMVAFRTPVEALHFALTLYVDTGHPKVKIRAGIHVGTVRIIDNDLFGGMVNYTARVLAAADEDSIMVSDPAKFQIVQELGIDNRELLFSDLKTKLKGFDDPYKHKLWSVETRKMRRAAEARNRRSWDRMMKDFGEFISDLKALRDEAGSEQG
ncbi:MAG TPA: adenylate/guanylate cyclase domain-containing protein [Pyrinomonadaceae bacterium]